MQSKEDKNTKFNSANVGEGLNPMRKRIAQNMRQSLAEKTTYATSCGCDRLLDFKTNYHRT